MKYCIITVITLIFCSTNLIANEGCYKILGINTSKSKKIVKPKTQKNSIKIKHISKNSTKSTISKLFKHTKIKKTSKDTTLYGVGANYKLSKKVKLSVDILAEVDMNRDAISIQEKTAEVKVALSI
ncbi:MAG: hypothetical protein GXO60_08585 [Epsilonproteobacteria bacterium]|nr:hypothetical protein [Campylobacterota bacterium]